MLYLISRSIQSTPNFICSSVSLSLADDYTQKQNRNVLLRDLHEETSSLLSISARSLSPPPYKLYL